MRSLLKASQQLLVFLLLLFLFLSQISLAADPFVTTWEIIDGDLTIDATGNYTFELYKGGTLERTGDQSTGTMSGLDIGGTYTLHITANTLHFRVPHHDNSELKSVDSWGDIKWTSFANSFEGCTMLTTVPTDSPNLTLVTDMSYMFAGASSFNADISSWNVGSIQNMSYMFAAASSFSADISSWDVSSVSNMSGMFFGANSFNQELSSWDVSNVVSMSDMFARNTTFNKPLDWRNKTQKVLDMSFMFQGCTSFNQDVSSWNVSKVENMIGMFLGASSFNYSLGEWQLNALTTAVRMLENSGIDVDKYDATLIGWYSHLRSMPARYPPLNIGAKDREYCKGRDAREGLKALGYEMIDDKDDCKNVTQVEVVEDFVYATTYDELLRIVRNGVVSAPAPTSTSSFTVSSSPLLTGISINHGHLQVTPDAVGVFDLTITMTDAGATTTHSIRITVEKAPQTIDATALEIIGDGPYTIKGVKLKRPEGGVMIDKTPTYIIKSTKDVVILQDSTFSLTGEVGQAQIYASKSGDDFYYPAAEIFITELNTYDQDQPNAITDRLSKSTKIYPNPSAKGAKIHIITTPKTQKLKSAYIVDKCGRQVEASIQREKDHYTLVVDLPRGLYMLIFQTQEGKVIRHKLSIL